MSMAKAEKICRNDGGPASRRYAKRKASRIRRRAEKRDPENAPTRLREVIRGWTL